MADEAKQIKNTEVKVNVVDGNLQQNRFEKNRSKVRTKRPDRRDNSNKEKDPFEHKIISIRRVTKMFKGGRRMKLSVFVAVGDRKGRVGLGLGKGDDVKSAQEKAITQAKKNLVLVPLKGNTIPHEVLNLRRPEQELLRVHR